MEKVLDKFLRYVKVETTSNEESLSQPSSKKEWDLLNLLKKELQELSIKDVFLSNFGYLYAKLPSNSSKNLPKLCFVAHVDTSSDVSGQNVKPILTKNYNGKDIILNENTILSPNDYPELLDYIGDTIISSSGDTLLGADDKAGIAEIMSMLEFFVTNKEIEHGEICICFTPDEEIGRGTENFDVEFFNADFGYTVDGGKLGELEYENFNACGMVCEFFGKTIHPGSAKNKMRNALNLAVEFHNMLPQNMRPEHTENYEGFYHLTDLNGDVEYAKSEYLIREHDEQLFNDKKALVVKIQDLINLKHGENSCKVTLKDRYYNMSKIIKQHFHLIENASKAMEILNITPSIVPIRGGTDGASLSYKNLPCANLCTGGHNFHSKYEFIPLKSMEKTVEILINIVKIYTNYNK